MKHGATSGRKTTKEYRAWISIKRRCYNKNFHQYKDYGGRGIVVCERWNKSFQAFLLDIGLSPSKKHSIDRIDNNGNYEPSNCRWSTMKEQNNNRRKRNINGEKNPASKLTISQVMEIRKDERTQKEIGKQYGITQNMVSKIKLRQAWSAF